MQIVQNRRDFLASASLAAAAGVLAARRSLADDGPPETTTIRLGQGLGICAAPSYIADDLLRAEGFTDIQLVPTAGGFAIPQMVGRGDIDFALSFAAAVVFHLDGGVPITALAGVHSGCFELFAHAPIQTISDLKGKRVGIRALRSGSHLYLAMMATHVGLDPHNDIAWVTRPDGSVMELFADRGVDVFLGFPPEPQELRARQVGRVILNTTMDKPWSEYFCCMVFGNRNFVLTHPMATKRYLRAILKAADICAAAPGQVAQTLVDRGFTPRYDFALQTLTDVPYGKWRDYDPEDTIRFYALRLHEAGMITSTPGKIIAEGTDWRFLNELKRELKV
jgi:NitT/TauT family transport system substrate-binding protein